MNCTKTAMVLAISLSWAQDGVGQSVYRCEEDSEIVYSQVPCSQETIEQSAAERERDEEIESKAPDRQSDDPVRMARHNCRVRGTGTTEAIVEVVSDLPRPVRVRLTIHFIRNGDIIGVEKPTFTVSANSSETISRLGPLNATADQCEYSLEAAL